jgi:hypothetical protein
VLTAHLALLGKQQNEDVRKISSWAAIIAVPTMIAGFYGMNFDYMPQASLAVRLPDRHGRNDRRLRRGVLQAPQERPVVRKIMSRFRRPAHYGRSS